MNAPLRTATRHCGLDPCRGDPYLGWSGRLTTCRIAPVFLYYSHVEAEGFQEVPSEDFLGCAWAVRAIVAAFFAGMGEGVDVRLATLQLILFSLWSGADGTWNHTP